MTLSCTIYILKKLQLQYPQKFRVISKTFGNTLVVWFYNSGSFIMFEQPAAEVFKMMQDQIKMERIISYCKDKHNFSDTRATQFVIEIVERCNYYNNKSHFKHMPPANFVKIENSKLLASINYKIGNYIFAIAYGNQLLFNTIHPPFAHLETSKSFAINDFLELRECEESLLLKCNEELVEYFKKTESEFFKGAVFKKLYSLIHRVPDENWMMTLHASGIISENKAILFVADSGRGKSTLTALLVAKGYRLLSDDFVALDTNSMVYSFPAGISVKSTAKETLTEYFPELCNSSTKINSSVDTISYIPNYHCQLQVSYKIKAVVFLNYNKTGKFAFKKMIKKNALPPFLKQSWISPKPEMVGIFFDWFAATTFYTLNYSKFEDANRVIMQIFNL